jgi:D-methionine transport system substrate-binding protein
LIDLAEGVSSICHLSRRQIPAATTAALAGDSIARAARAADAPLRVGVISGGAELIGERVIEQAAQRNRAVKVVPFGDYILPNEALAHGALDANAFQHQPYLDNQIKNRGYRIVPAGFTILAPIGLYSHRLKSITDLPDGAKIGIRDNIWPMRIAPAAMISWRWRLVVPCRSDSIPRR